MNTHEAVAERVARAQVASRKWHLAAAVVIVACIFGCTAFFAVLTRVLHVLPAKLAGFGLAGVVSALSGGVVVGTRAVIRRRLAALRPEWVDDVARREGLSASELGSYFTLDSW